MSTDVDQLDKMLAAIPQMLATARTQMLEARQERDWLREWAEKTRGFIRDQVCRERPGCRPEDRDSPDCIGWGLLDELCDITGEDYEG